MVKGLTLNLVIQVLHVRQGKLLRWWYELTLNLDANLILFSCTEIPEVQHLTVWHSQYSDIKSKCLEFGNHSKQCQHWLGPFSSVSFLPWPHWEGQEELLHLPQRTATVSQKAPSYTLSAAWHQGSKAWKEILAIGLLSEKSCFAFHYLAIVWHFGNHKAASLLEVNSMCLYFCFVNIMAEVIWHSWRAVIHANKIPSEVALWIPSLSLQSAVDFGCNPVPSPYMCP